MAHFYGIIHGSARTPATRIGTKNSGIETIAQGEHAGIRVYATNTSETTDVFTVAMTGGRYGASYKVLGSLIYNADPDTYPAPTTQWYTAVDPEISNLNARIEKLENALSIAIAALEDSNPIPGTSWLKRVLNAK